jgi:hypothetical protein
MRSHGRHDGIKIDGADVCRIDDDLVATELQKRVPPAVEEPITDLLLSQMLDELARLLALRPKALEANDAGIDTQSDPTWNRLRSHAFSAFATTASARSVRLH